MTKSSWSGHCCAGTAVYDLGVVPTKVFEIWSVAYQYPDTGRGEFKDLNGDNVYEFITNDPVKMGCAATVISILQYDKAQRSFVGASPRFASYYTQTIADLTKAATVGNFCSLTPLVSTLLYLGKTDEAKAEFDRLYRQNDDFQTDAATVWSDLETAVKNMRYYVAP